MIRPTERLSAAQFRDALRQVIRFRQQAPIDDPLASTVKRIEQNPAFAQARLLTRILVALTHERGEFRRAELGALGAETYAMVIALIDAFEAGTFPRGAEPGSACCAGAHETSAPSVAGVSRVARPNRAGLPAAQGAPPRRRVQAAPTGGKMRSLSRLTTW